MTDFIPSEKGVPIRFPSSAYFNIDSTDRFSVTGPVVGESAGNFAINRNLNMLNGFFTRLAIQEVYCDWCVDNISSFWNNNVFTVDISGAPVSFAVTLPGGNWNVQEVLDYIVQELNLLTAPTYVFSLGTTPYGAKTLDLSGGDFSVLPSNLQAQLNILANVFGNSYPIACPKLLAVTYIDFTSPIMTQNQDVNDSTTSPVSRNLLYRWWLAWEDETSYDSYGYPIYQGYKPFIARRFLAFPKQIQWPSNQPLGSLTFQVYTSTGDLVPASGEVGEFEWGMTVLASEV